MKDMMKRFGCIAACAAASTAFAGGGGNEDEGKTALIALNPTDEESFVMSGRVEIQTDLIYVNSTAVGALYTNGTTEILSPQVYVGGTASFEGDPYTGTLHESAVPIEDPFLNTPVPPVNENKDLGSIETAPNGWEIGSPGYYSGGITVERDSTLMLLPGIYILDGRGLSMMGQSTVVANGAVFIIIGDGEVDIAAGASLMAAPPSSGVFKNISLYQVKENQNIVSIGGGGGIAIAGAIYAPGATVSIGGTSGIATMGPNIGDLVVADKIRLSGNGKIGFGEGDFRLPYTDPHIDWD